MQKTQNNDTVVLIELAKGLLRRKWLIILVTVFCGVASLLYALIGVTPMYEANALFYVNNTTAEASSTYSYINYNDLTTAQTLINTYAVILQSRMVLNDIIDKADLPYTTEELGKMITASSVNNTEVFSIVVKSSSPTEAEHIANTILQILPEKISEVVIGSSVRVVDYAVVPAEKSSPILKYYLVFGALIGFFIVCIIVTITEMFDDVIKNSTYIKQNFEEPVLAVIPDMQEDDRGYGYRIYHSRGRRSRKAGM